MGKLFSEIKNFVGLIKNGEKNPPYCNVCHCKMELERREWLFLLPVWTDHTYTASATYYQNHLVPIQSLAEIPVGRRACRLVVYRCPNDQIRKVRVIDFLYSRGTEVLMLFDDYEYSAFREMLERL